jgi:membrane protease subunit (stomatin/prohibitin family)
MSSGSSTDHEAEFIRGNLIGVGIAALIGGVFGVLNNPSEPLSGFVGGVIVFGMVVGFIAAGLIRQQRKSSRSQQQQQQVGGDSEPTRICPDCGWKNPESNNYCNDCGYELNE